MQSRATWLARLGLGTLVLGLTACGGGGGGGGGSAAPAAPPIATAADNYFALDASARWVYAGSSGATASISRVAGTQSTAGGTGTLVRSTDTSDGSVDATVYVVGAGGVRQYATPGADALDRAFDGVELMRWPAQAGDTFVQADTTVDAGTDYDGDGRNDRVAVRADLTAVARETVVTPAGTFTDALHQRQTIRTTVLPSSGASPVVIDFTIDTWYGRGIGPVKSVTLVRTAGQPDSTTTETLSAYRVGGIASETVAPTVLSVTPGTAAVRGVGATISAVFSEAMDVDTLSAGAFSVVDSANVAVAGAVQVLGNTVSFVPVRALGSGSYTARIGTSAQDLVGNALASARSWSFSIDSTAPGIAASSPAMDAVDVALDSTIVLDFTEPPDPATLTTQTISLSDSAGTLPFTVSVVGSRVTITPTGGLQRARRYALTVFNVADRLGNVQTQSFVLPFRTTQGRFAFPVDLLERSTSLATAVGDVNGDGFTDLLIVSRYLDVIGNYALYVRTGAADGSLSEPVRVDTGPNLAACGPASIAVGDVTGDGRNDVVVAASGCGVQVLRQTVSGTLVPGVFLPRPFAQAVRLADIDGDGRLDVVVREDSTATPLQIWRQDTGGGLVAMTPPSLQGLSGVRDFAVGDVTGDGRADLVLTLSAQIGQDLAVLVQQADGSFAAPLVRSTESVWGATSLALGDLNGDGRTDIVVTTGGNSPTYLAVYYQGTGGAVGPLTRIPTYDIPSLVRVADLNGDGRADIVVSHQGWSAVGIYLQQADGQLAAEDRYAANYGSSSSEALAIGDLTRDGRPDIVYDGQLLRQLPMAQATPQRLLPGRTLQRMLGTAAALRR